MPRQTNETHTPAGGGDANHELDYFHLKRVSKVRAEERKEHTARKGMSKGEARGDKAYCSRIRQRPLRL